MVSDDDSNGPGGATAPPGPVDELFCYDGYWYLYTPEPVFPLPPFESDFSETREQQHHRRMIADLLWSYSVVNRTGPLCVITGV